MTLVVLGLWLIGASGKSVAVLPPSLDEAAAEEVPERLDEVILDAVRQVEGVDAIGIKDVQEMLAYEAQKQILGCTDDTDCLAEIFGALNVDELIVFSIASVDGRWLVTAKRLDPRAGRVLARENRILDGGASGVLAAVGSLVGKLFGTEVEIRGPGTVVEVTEVDASRTNVSIDVGGIGFYGPALHFELGSAWAGHGRFRALGFGLLNRGAAFDDIANESLGLGLAFGGGVRRYLSQTSNLRGAYLGAAAEYWYIQVRDEDFDREAYVNQGILFMGEAGYRLTLSGRFFLGGGVGFGYFANLRSSTRDLSNGQDPFLNEPLGGSGPAFSVALEVGYSF